MKMKTPLLAEDYNAKINAAHQEENQVPESTNESNSSSDDRNNQVANFDTNNNNNQTSPVCCQIANGMAKPASIGRNVFNNQAVNLSPQSMNSTRSNNGLNSAILCRICYTADSEPLIQPCNCSGTMGLMHKTCLEKWLSQANSNRCEICQFQFQVRKQPRSFSQWLFRPLTFKDNKNLFNDLICLIILTPLAVISTWYCVLFAMKFHEEENRWEASGLVVLTTFLLFIYILWFIFSCKYHYKVFKDWQNKNQIITVKFNNENKTTSSVYNLKNGVNTVVMMNNESEANNKVELNLQAIQNNHFELLSRYASTGYQPQNQHYDNPGCSVILLETSINDLTLPNDNSQNQNSTATTSSDNFQSMMQDRFMSMIDDDSLKVETMLKEAELKVVTSNSLSDQSNNDINA